MSLLGWWRRGPFGRRRADIGEDQGRRSRSGVGDGAEPGWQDALWSDHRGRGGVSTDREGRLVVVALGGFLMRPASWANGVMEEEGS